MNSYAANLYISLKWGKCMQCNGGSDVVAEASKTVIF